MDNNYKVDEQKKGLHFNIYNYIWGGLIILILAFLYRINCIYPYVTDDFNYSFIYGETTRLEGIHDIFVSQARHYMECNGRYIVHFLAQLMLSMDKAVFNILNVIHYAGLSTLICLLSTKKIHLHIWLLILLTLWCIMPQPGATVFWLTGSFNYIWAAGMVIAFTVCLLSQYRSLNITALFLAIPAGNTHEGLVMGVFVSLVLYSILTKKKNKLHIIALLLFFVGVLSNILAPGTFQRLQTVGVQGDSGIQALCFKCLVSVYKIIKGIFSTSCDWGIQVCVVLFIITSVYLIRKVLNKKQTTTDILALCFLFGALCNVCMILPTGLTYGRVLFGFCFLSYLAFCVAFLSKLLLLPRYSNLIILTSTVLLCSIPCINAYATVSIFAHRMKYIESCAKKGEKTIRDLPISEQISHRYVDSYCMFPNENQNHFAALYFNTGEFSVLSPRIYQIMEEHSQAMQTMTPNEWVVTNENHVIYCLKEKPKKSEILVDAFGSTSSLDKYLPQFIKNLHKPGRRHTIINLFTMHGKYFATWDMQAPTGKLIIHYNEKTQPQEVYFNIEEQRCSK